MKHFILYILIIILASNVTIAKENNIYAIYDRPYSLTENIIDYSSIGKNLGLIAGASVIGAGILYLLPESVTNWNKDDIKNGNLFKRWRKHVKEGPVMDKDDWYLNWITHPYWGAAYYMSARTNGANAFYSFLFSAFASTFFWEYGIEAFAEIPSKQDLIITPVIGSILGEGFYLAKRHILENDHRLLNSKILGHTITFIMDPINEFFDLFKDKKNSDKNNIQAVSFPSYSNEKGFGYNLVLNINF